MSLKSEVRRHVLLPGLFAAAGLGGCAYYPVEPGPTVGVVGSGAVYVQQQPVVRYVHPVPVYVGPPPVVLHREVIRPLPGHLHPERPHALAERRSPERKHCHQGIDDCRRR